MISKKNISFKPNDTSFVSAKKLTKKDWIDTSFAHSERAIGQLRLPAVGNGRYQRKHPILDANENLVGYLSGAVNSIGYTWNCIYVANCFWLTNMTFSETMGGTNRSSITLVDEVGTFLFSSTKKFQAIQSFNFEGSWAGSTVAFKLLNDERELFYLTNLGFSLFDTYRRNRVSHVNFPIYLSEHQFDFTISPKVKILAIAASSTGEKDPIDGEYRYKNFIWLYDFETGELIGEQKIDIETYNSWTIEFNESGRLLRITSNSSIFQFELSAK